MHDEKGNTPAFTAPMGDPMDQSREHQIAVPEPPSTPEPPAAPPPSGLLPGIAGISIYMLITAMMGVFTAFRGPAANNPSARLVILPVCTMIVVGVFGLLRMKRWGWALVLAGTLMLMLGYLYVGHAMHNPGVYVMAGLDLLFFLYLARPEVRERLR